jgi:cytochrome c oxidase subunit 2
MGWLPESVSTYGGDVDSLLLLIFYIIGVWFILAEVVLIGFAIAYRKRSGKRAAWVPGTSLKHLSWVLIPCIVILGLDLAIDAAGAPVWRDIKETLPEPDLTVRVIGKQFAWDFVHPGQDGLLDTDDDISSEFELFVPVDSVVRFELVSNDVLHSFWLPHFRLKQDIVPGRAIKGWFQATKTGSYPVACAELCGLGHGTMRGRLHVQSIAEHEAWLAEQVPTDDFWE